MMSYFVIITGIFLLDQCLKKWIERNKKVNKKCSVLNGKIMITNHHNKGAMFNFLEKKPNFIKGIACVTLGYVIFLLRKILLREKAYLTKFGICMVLGGGFSNVYDRLKYGYVVDYFIINYKKLKKVILNVADVFIFIGVFLIFIEEFFNNKLFE